MERINPLPCKQCGASFVARNRNGVTREFCSRECKTAWHNRERLRSFKESRAARQITKAWPAKQMRRSERSRQINLAAIPLVERPALLAEAARRLGMTDQTQHCHQGAV